jgi:hypothetical protein
LQALGFAKISNLMHHGDMINFHAFARFIVTTTALIMFIACGTNLNDQDQQPLDFPYVLSTIEPVQIEIDRESNFLVYRVRCIADGQWSGIRVRTRTVNGSDEAASTPPQPRNCQPDDATTPVLAGQIMRLNDLRARQQIKLVLQVDQPQQSTWRNSTLEVGENGVLYETSNVEP